jgi:DNA-binding NtrC family response regulator
MTTRKILWLTDAPSTALPLGLDGGYKISWVEDLIQATEILEKEEIDGFVIGREVPGLSRLEVLAAVRSVNPPTPVIFAAKDLTALEAVSLARNGAFHCLDLHTSLHAFGKVLEDACEESRRARRLQARRQSTAWDKLLIGESRAMQDVMSMIEIVGPRRCTVLIKGETGTGKELAARALHMVSPRSHLPMVAVNCSALPENLLEAELFGHVKGAFTGAISNRVGRFEQANKSTLFLDEIGELPLPLQAKLLRALQEREIQRLGSSETIHVDVRVIAATNANLEERIRQGTFREDLYYRLNVVPLRMPPLRERRSDIPILIDHFSAKICNAEDIPPKRIAPEVRERLSDLPWPGNVRQIENLVEMAIALSGDRETIFSSDFGLPAPVLKPAISSEGGSPFNSDLSEPIRFDAVVEQFEQSILQMALAKTGGNKTAAAEFLGMKRTTLIMKLRGMQEATMLARSA